MTTMHILGIRVSVPESWDELTHKQLRYLVDQSKLKISPEELKLSMFLYCIGARVLRSNADGLYKLRIGWHRALYTNAETLANLSESMTFLIEPATEQDEKRPRFYLSPKFVNAPFAGGFLLHLRWFRAPKYLLSDALFEQFLTLSTYAPYIDQPNAMPFLAAAMYHTGSTFKGSRHLSDAGALAYLPEWKLVVMYWFWLSSLRWMADTYPRIFSGSGEKSEGNTASNQLHLVNALADGDVCKMPLVRAGTLQDALVAMDASIQRQEEAESRRKNS